jgi:hypothetical protein
MQHFRDRSGRIPLQKVTSSGFVSCSPPPELVYSQIYNLVPANIGYTAI